MRLRSKFYNQVNKFLKKPTEKKESIPNSRIQKRPEAEKLLSFIDRLKEKEKELHKGALKNGADSLDYSKHTIVSTLLSDINEKISAFNEKSPEREEYDELKSIIKLAQDLLCIIEKIMAEHSETLKKPRDYKLKAAAHSVDIGACGAVYGAAALVGLSSFGTGLALVAAAPELGHASRKAFGLDDLQSATSLLLIEFQTSLKQMIQNLSLTLNLLRPKETKAEGIIEENSSPQFRK